MTKELPVLKASWFNTRFDSNHRNLGLDIARTLCVLIIIGMHTNNYLGPFAKVYKYLFPVGYIAQDLLFALSGFLVGKQILRYVNTSSNQSGLLKFYKNRWLRIVPLYWAFLVVNLLLFFAIYQHSGLSFFNTNFSVAEYFFFFQNFAWQHPVFFPEIWPLAIEEWSFLLMPIAVYAGVRLFKKALTPKQLIALIVLQILIFSALRIDYILKANPDSDWGLRKIVLYRLDALLYGFLALILFERFPAFFKRNRIYLLVGGMGGSLLIYYGGLKLNGELYKSLLFTAVPLCCSMALTYFYASSFTALPARLKAMTTHISLMGYSLLLTHLYFLQFLMLCVYTPNSLPEALVFTLIYFTILSVLSTAIYNFVERPLLSKRNT